MADDTEHWILVVEDDPEMREGILLPGLKHCGFNAVGAGSAIEAYRCMLARDFSLFVLDIGLPDENGLTMAKHLRTVTQAGIVMLTGRNVGRDDHIRGLEQGADAYITKPVDIDLLAANCHSLLRRLGRLNAQRPSAAFTSSWRLEMDRWNLASPEGAKVKLTHAERLLISMLAESPGETVTRDTLISRLARDIHDFDPHRLEMLVHRLRRKVSSITSERLPLNAVRGIGYVLLAKP